MIIEKEILSKIPRDYVFIVQTVKLDTAYFKKRIAEGVKNSSINYKTNVKGKHTDWNFFNYDFLSGNDACNSITYFNSDLYYLSDADDRPS